MPDKKDCGLLRLFLTAKHTGFAVKRKTEGAECSFRLKAETERRELRLTFSSILLDDGSGSV